MLRQFDAQKLLIWNNKGAKLLPFTVLHDGQDASVLCVYHVPVNTLGVGAEVPPVVSTLLFLRLGRMCSLHAKTVVPGSGVVYVMTIFLGDMVANNSIFC